MGQKTEHHRKVIGKFGPDGCVSAPFELLFQHDHIAALLLVIAEEVVSQIGGGGRIEVEGGDILFLSDARGGLTNSAKKDWGTSRRFKKELINYNRPALLLFRIVEHPGKGFVAGGNGHFVPLVFFRIPKPLAPLR
jgi:hypothetical protein